MEMLGSITRCVIEIACLIVFGAEVVLLGVAFFGGV